MIVYQIAIGDIPEHIQKCMDSVSAWSYAQKHPYKLITELPPGLQGWDIRAASNYMRMKYACENAPCLYVDWDVEFMAGFKVIADGFVADKTNPDALFFFKESDIPKKIMAEYEFYISKTHTAGLEPGRLWKIIRDKFCFVCFCELGHKHWFGSRKNYINI